jgi:hypothetical protein
MLRPVPRAPLWKSAHLIQRAAYTVCQFGEIGISPKWQTHPLNLRVPLREPMRFTEKDSRMRFATRMK